MRKRLTERVKFTGTVDRTGAYPVIRGVLLCGPTSANRRRYKKEAFASGRVQKYVGRPVFIDHGDARSPRSYRDKIGTIENARVRPDGMPVGDIAVNPKHPAAEQLLWDAEHKPGSCGMSHVAQCSTTAGADGWDVVESVDEVESVDVVVSPATTKGLYEGKDGGRTWTPRRLVEWVKTHKRATPKTAALARRLMEVSVHAGTEDEPYLPEPAADADPNAAILAGLKQAAAALVDAALAGEIDRTELFARLKELLGTADQYRPDPADGDTDPGTGGGEDPALFGEQKAPPTDGKAFGEWLGIGRSDQQLNYTPGFSPPASVSTEYRRTDPPPAAAGPAGAPPTDGKRFAEWVK